jgi:hypothetical protein
MFYLKSAFVTQTKTETFDWPKSHHMTTSCALWKSGNAYTHWWYEMEVPVSLMFEINISACHLWGCGFDSRSDPFLMWQRGCLSDSVGFLRGSGFHLHNTLHYKSPNIVHRANNVSPSWCSALNSIFTYQFAHHCQKLMPRLWKIPETLKINLKAMH